MHGVQNNDQTARLDQNALSRADTDLAVPFIPTPSPETRRAQFKRPETMDRYVDANGAVLMVNKPISSSRMAAMSAFGILIGAGSILIFSSFVRASSDTGLFELNARDNSAKRHTEARMDTAKSGQQFAALSTTAPLSASSLGAMPASGVRGAERLPTSAQTARATAKLSPIVMRTPGSQQIASNMSRRSVCVRMCDGYHFPLGRLGASESEPAHEAMCRAACPGAPVKVFVVAAGQDSIANAVSSDGRTYRSLPMAYAHERGKDPACGCEANGTSVSLPVVNDPTLRKGDTIVVEGGAQVFSGKDSKDQTPVSSSDFADFRQSRALSPLDRRNLDSLVGQAQRNAVLNDMKRKARAQEARGPKTFANGKGADAEQHIVIRSGTSQGERTTVRVITPSLYAQPR
jgi:hypothetical protein